MSEQEDEDIDLMVLELAARLNINVQESDIEVSHRVGPSRRRSSDDDHMDDADEGDDSKPKEIIVKFRDPKARLALLKSRAKLRKKSRETVH